MKNFTNKRVLITGGAGFIGSNLAHALVKEGAEVTILDAMLPLYGGNVFNLKEIKDRVKFIKGDIRDKEAVKKTVEGQDIIFDLAAQVSYIDSKDQPFLDLDINAKGHLTVLEAVRQYAPTAKLLFASSRLVYGRIKTTPVTEEHPTDPLSIYGIHKLLGEKYCRYYADAFGLHMLSVRIPNPYGPRQQMKHNKYSIAGWFIRQAMAGQTMTIFGDGRQARDYLYIDDIVQAFLTLAKQAPAAGEVYNIGTHERVQFRDMVEAVVAEVGQGQIKYVSWPPDYEKNETGDYIADTRKIAQFGWQAYVNLQQGIKQTVEYYKKYQTHYW